MCPRCHRAIPGAFRPGGPMGSIAPRRWALPTPGELIRLCPVDGPLARTHPPRPLTTDALRTAATHLQDTLNARRDRSWAQLFGQALSRRDDDFLVLLGHSLALLLRRGPLQDLDISQNELEQLLVDTVAAWPPRLVE